MAYSHDMELDSLLLAQSLVDGTDFRSGPQAKSGWGHVGEAGE